MVSSCSLNKLLQEFISKIRNYNISNTEVIMAETLHRKGDYIITAEKGGIAT